MFRIDLDQMGLLSGSWVAETGAISRVTGCFKVVYSLKGCLGVLGFWRNWLLTLEI